MFDLGVFEKRQREQHCHSSARVCPFVTYDMPSVCFLCKDINSPRFNFGSGEITNGPLLLEAAENDKEIILPTGMSALKQVRSALKTGKYLSKNNLTATHTTGGSPLYSTWNYFYIPRIKTISLRRP